MSLKTNKSLNMGIGAPSLLVVFLVLSLVSFSVLSYASARADHRRMENFEDRTTAYYKACNAAETKVAAISTLLITLDTTGGADTFYQKALERLDAYTVDERTQELSFSTEMTDAQSLFVTLKLVYTQDPNAKRYKITQWQVIQTEDWQPDNTLNLMEG